MASDILVVDDEADIRELISGILEDEGHSTRLAKDSDETLQTIEERRPNNRLKLTAARWQAGARPQLKRVFSELLVAVL